MPTTVPGRATYRAFRLFGATTVIASGETPNLNDKVDLVPLPFFIFPPMFQFVFIHADISLPATKPFVYEEAIAFPPTAKIIRIQDADGVHSVPIADVVTPIGLQSVAADDGGTNYCVFSWIGINTLLVAKCDAILPAVYTRVFGPDTRAACDAYVIANGGIAA